MEINDIQKASLSKPPIGKGIFIVALFLLVVFGIWYFSSGIQGDISKKSAELTTKIKSSAKTPMVLEDSYYHNWIKFVPSASVKEVYPGKEYVEVEVTQPNLSGADATKWVLKNSQGDEAALGVASTLPLSGKVSPTEALKIKAGDHIFVSTGRSPIGVSFRINKCSAYMEQFQDFVPPISGECPSITFDRNLSLLDNNCQVFVRGIRPCEANTRPLPSGVTVSCKAFLDSTVNYNGCVTTHKNDPDFYLKEWRIFLGKEKEMWMEPKDTVLLLDDKGKLIDTFKY